MENKKKTKRKRDNERKEEMLKRKNIENGKEDM